MDLFKQGMKGPIRPAPAVPRKGVNRYSPVTNWNDDPFGADVFEPKPEHMQKKVPPPRPPPPRVNKGPDVPAKPSHFIRRPTVLTSLLNRKKCAASNQINSSIVSQQTPLTDFSAELDPNRVFPKCEPKSIQTGTLIDLSSPPSSPTFTTRSSSDGLSVDSFGSDATTSTNHHNPNNGGNASQAESGFEDDFDLFLNSRKNIAKEDTYEDFTSVDPFSPQPVVIKPPIMQKPVISRDLYETKISSSSHISGMKGPTIIRAKPTRPKPPENSALLKNTFGSSFPSTLMNVNTTTPIQKIGYSFADNYDSKPLGWDSSPERESSPPMPSIPPPPPPPVTDEDLPLEWPEGADLEEFNTGLGLDDEETEKPYGVALFDYFTDHPDDLCFSTNSRINLIRRVDADWLYGSLRSGAEGIFPSNYVEIKVPLPNDPAPPPAALGRATALYHFEPAQPGDLKFQAGDTITVLHKLSDEWYFGQCNGVKGQFPINYVQMC